MLQLNNTTLAVGLLISVLLYAMGIWEYFHQAVSDNFPGIFYRSHILNVCLNFMFAACT